MHWLAGPERLSNALCYRGKLAEGDKSHYPNEPWILAPWFYQPPSETSFKKGGTSSVAPACFYIAHHVPRQEVSSPPFLTFLIRAFLSSSTFGLLLVPLAPPQHQLTARARQKLPGSRAGSTPSDGAAGLWGAAEEPPFPPCPPLKCSFSASPVANSSWWYWPIICTAPEETGKISFGSMRILLPVTRKVTFFSLWRLWINSLAWENRLKPCRQVHWAQDRQMETGVSVCYRELSEGSNSSHWFLEGLICCW